MPTDSLDSLDLATRELLLRSTLDPRLSREETEEQVADWLRRQPEHRAENVAIVRGQLLVAREALVKARDAAEILGWRFRAEQLTVWVRELGLMEGVVEG